MINTVVYYMYFSSSSSSLTPGTSLRGSTPFKNFTRTPINPPGSCHHSSSVTPGTSGPSVLVGKSVRFGSVQFRSVQFILV